VIVCCSKVSREFLINRGGSLNCNLHFGGREFVTEGREIQDAILIDVPDRAALESALRQ